MQEQSRDGSSLNDPACPDNLHVGQRLETVKGGVNSAFIGPKRWKSVPSWLRDNGRTGLGGWVRKVC